MGNRRAIESIVIVSLFIVFGLTTLSLLVAGSKSYELISSKKECQSELRLAVSYINMKIRQYDAAGQLTVEPNPVNGKDAICIHETFNQKTYKTWIYFDDRTLREATVEQGLKLTKGMSFEIASLNDVTFTYDTASGEIRAELTKMNGATTLKTTTAIFLKSGIGGGSGE